MSHTIYTLAAAVADRKPRGESSTPPHLHPEGLEGWEKEYDRLAHLPLVDLCREARQVGLDPAEYTMRD